MELNKEINVVRHLNRCALPTGIDVIHILLPAVEVAT